MQLHTNTHEVEIGGNSPITNFKLELNAKTAFLLQSPYTDPILAVIRELICNALDAAGHATVHLPNQMEPWFAVSDTGPGITHDNMLDLYTTYGASTKDGSNAAIGGFGIGRFSALSYGESFTVISMTTDKAFYTVTKNDHGVPILLSNMIGPNVDNRTGFEVRVPVKAGDMTVFADKLKTFLVHVPEDQVTVTGQNIEVNRPIAKVVSTDGRWELREVGAYSSHRRHIATMGPVAYRLDPSKLKDIPPAIAELMSYASFTFHFQMGEVMVAPSREELSYVPHTLAALSKAFYQINADLIDQLQDKIRSAPTLWEARLIAEEFGFGSGDKIGRLLGKNFLFKGKTYNNEISIETQHSVGYISQGKLYSKRNNRIEWDYHFSLTHMKLANVRVLIRDVPRYKIKDLLRMNYDQEYGHKLGFYILDPLEDISGWVDIESMPIVKLSELPEQLPVLPKGTSYRNRVRIKSFDIDRETWVEVNHDIKAGGVYLPMSGRDVIRSKIGASHIKMAMATGLVDAVYGIPQTVRTADKMAQLPGWVHAQDAVKEALIAKLTNMPQAALSSYIVHHITGTREDNSEVIYKLISSLPSPAPDKTVAAVQAAMPKALLPDHLIKPLAELCRRFDLDFLSPKNFDKDPEIVAFKRAWRNLRKKFPLLTQLERMAFSNPSTTGVSKYLNL